MEEYVSAYDIVQDAIQHADGDFTFIQVDVLKDILNILDETKTLLEQAKSLK